LEHVGKVLARVVSKNRLFKLMCSRVQKNVQVVEYLKCASAQVVKKEDNLTIWHKKLGHLSKQTKTSLYRKT
jgi:hypothetical protein